VTKKYSTPLPPLFPEGLSGPELLNVTPPAGSAAYWIGFPQESSNRSSPGLCSNSLRLSGSRPSLLMNPNTLWLIPLIFRNVLASSEITADGTMTFSNTRTPTHIASARIDHGMKGRTAVIAVKLHQSTALWTAQSRSHSETQALIDFPSWMTGQRTTSASHRHSEYSPTRHPGSIHGFLNAPTPHGTLYRDHGNIPKTNAIPAFATAVHLPRPRFWRTTSGGHGSVQAKRLRKSPGPARTLG